MAQKTELALSATPGGLHSFVAKPAAGSGVAAGCADASIAAREFATAALSRRELAGGSTARREAATAALEDCP
jgi:hypothetical protein